VEIDVDEAPELALLVVEVLPETLVPAGQVGQQLADGRAFDLDDVLFAGEGAQRCRDMDFRGHGSQSVAGVARAPAPAGASRRSSASRSGSNWDRSSRSVQDVMSRGSPFWTETITYEKDGQAWSR